MYKTIQISNLVLYCNWIIKWTSKQQLRQLYDIKSDSNLPHLVVEKILVNGTRYCKFGDHSLYQAPFQKILCYLAWRNAAISWQRYDDWLPQLFLEYHWDSDNTKAFINKWRKSSLCITNSVNIKAMFIQSG